jgi:hypothetical protein
MPSGGEIGKTYWVTIMSVNVHIAFGSSIYNIPGCKQALSPYFKLVIRSHEAIPPAGLTGIVANEWYHDPSIS